MTNKKRHLVVKFSAVLSGISGIVILVSSFWPIIEYHLTEGERYKTLLSPVVMDSKDGDKKEVKNDFTKASNWFPDSSKDVNFGASKVSYYTITIPKLRIQNATVAIGGEDLTKSLVQYPGTALPGKNGNAVIFGHSVLPIFFNPKNYTSIFSTLPTLVKGDEVFVEYDGVSYKFLVEDLLEIYPSDIQILEQNNNDAFITLVTCVPPGDPRNPKRLIVRARVVS